MHCHHTIIAIMVHIKYVIRERSFFKIEACMLQGGGIPAADLLQSSKTIGELNFIKTFDPNFFGSCFNREGGDGRLLKHKCFNLEKRPFP